MHLERNYSIIGIISKAMMCILFILLVMCYSTLKVGKNQGPMRSRGVRWYHFTIAQHLTEMGNINGSYLYVLWWTESHPIRSVHAPIKFIWTKEDIFHPAAERMCIIKFEHIFLAPLKSGSSSSQIIWIMLPMPPWNDRFTSNTNPQL